MNKTKLSIERIITFKEVKNYPLPNPKIHYSLHDLLNQNSKPDSRIIDYLSRGHFLTYSREGEEFDIFDPSKKIYSSRSLMTDGVWIWSKYVIHYYENYRINLPEKFHKHILIRGFSFPLLTEVEKGILTEQFSLLLDM